ncbi:S8 family peptidase [Herbidospora mongoliensis]|uniref:S8 family peptidase n=1 Tax=Herbidospora mongoliensis TaxID=688067 RepID=UPI00082E78D3|nr:S8/S53 family peptidase [Herbidospora mongoliensis]
MHKNIDSVRRTTIEAFYDNEIIVDSTQTHEVLGLIERWAGTGPAAWSMLGESEALGLDWVEVTGLPDVVTTLRAIPGLEDEAQRASERIYPDAPVTDLDLLLHALRAQSPNWIVGKHRLLDSIEGEPYTGGTGTIPVGLASGAPLERREAIEGRRLRVGVLDTPVGNHPQLTGRFLADTGDLLTERTPLPMLAGHAMAVAGIIADRAPAAELIVRSCLDETGVNASSWDVATKMMSLADEGVNVLNLSFAGFTADDEPPLVIGRAVERLVDRMTLVAAVGNHGRVDPSATGEHPMVTPGSKAFPAACARVIAVGAATKGVRPEFSPNVPWVSLVAPGEDVECLYLTGQVVVDKHGAEKPYEGYAAWSGTSFAAAAVSGAIADLAHRHQISPSEACDLLLRRSPAQMRPERHEDVQPPEPG